MAAPSERSEGTDPVHTSISGSRLEDCEASSSHCVSHQVCGTLVRGPSTLTQSEFSTPHFTDAEASKIRVMCPRLSHGRDGVYNQVFLTPNFTPLTSPMPLTSSTPLPTASAPKVEKINATNPRNGWHAVINLMHLN